MNIFGNDPYALVDNMDLWTEKRIKKWDRIYEWGLIVMIGVIIIVIVKILV